MIAARGFALAQGRCEREAASGVFPGKEAP
jgi:hypothetical protein